MINSNNYPPKKPKTCKKDIHTSAKVLIPVKLEPITSVGEIEVSCCGEPHVICKPNADNSSEIVISQTICLTIPIECGIKGSTCKAEVKCNHKECE